MCINTPDLVVKREHTLLRAEQSKPPQYPVQPLGFLYFDWHIGARRNEISLSFEALINVAQKWLAEKISH